jgi:hypothetical protein
VGVVVMGLVAGILYCCCCGSRRTDDESFDEENQWSSDDNSSANEKGVAFVPPGTTSKHLSMTSTLPLKRDNSTHSIRLLLNLPQTGLLARKLTKKKLAPRSRLELNASNSGPQLLGGLMFPITEFDSRLDSRAMFMAQNESKQTLGDENDYSRRILTVTNPE